MGRIGKQMKCNAWVNKEINVIFSPIWMVTSIQVRLGLVAGWFQGELEQMIVNGDTLRRRMNIKRVLKSR